MLNTIKMYNSQLFTSVKVGTTELKNRIVMAPMTRCRAIGNVPNDLMMKYYKLRSGAGLIISEGTSPSPNGLGWARMPGIFTDHQAEAWRKITSEVHKSNGKIFLQLMHCGRVSHPLNMPKGASIICPSAIRAEGKAWTDEQEFQDFPAPKEMDAHDFEMTLQEYVHAAQNAISVGFDGVEVNVADGLLLSQFLSPQTNQRTDEYGGSIENRCKFVLQVITSIAEVIGNERTGVYISPYSIARDIALYPEIESTYGYLSKQLSMLGIAYIHLINHPLANTPNRPFAPLDMIRNIRSNFCNTLILSGGYTKKSAERDLKNGLGDLIAFGEYFINNPYLVEHFQNNWTLAENLNTDLIHGADEEGYTDYPCYCQ